MGNCPCPRCLIPKDRTHQLATQRDQHQRKSLARVDNLQYRVKMTSAHEAIYEKNNAVNSKAVEDLLKTESLVPNQVFNLSLCWMFLDLITICRMHFLPNFPNLDSIYLVSFWLISCMNLSLVYGRRFSFICLEFLNVLMEELMSWTKGKMVHLSG